MTFSRIITVVILTLNCVRCEIEVDRLRSIKNNKIIIDTDAGSDDGVALMMALRKSKEPHGPEILAITCVDGNAKTEQVAINVLKAMRIVNVTDIPVYMGARTSMLREMPSDHFFGMDGFGDVPFPNPPTVDEVQKAHAVLALIELVKLHPNEITLVALGPLTNVALAVRIEPKFRWYLKNLYWMGASVTGTGNVRPGIEFNAWMDPEANYAVFNDTAPPVIVLPVEVDQVWNPIRMSWRRNVLGNARGPIVKFMNKIEARTFNSTFWSACDARVMSVALDPTLILSANLERVITVTQGEDTRGMFVVDSKNIHDQPKNAVIITNMDVNRFQSMCLMYLASS